MKCIVKIQRLVSPLRSMSPSKCAVGFFFLVISYFSLWIKKQFLIFAGVGAHQVCVDLCKVSNNKSCQIIFNMMQMIR